METQIWLVRHGETEWNRLRKIQGREDIELNKRGECQAYQVAASLKDEYFTAIISSPLQRAFKTATIIQNENLKSPPLVTDNDLVERDYGHLSGLTYDEKVKQSRSNNDLGVESLDGLTLRAKSVLNRLVERYEGERLLLVSHGGLIKSLLGIGLHNDFERSHIILDNCSVSKMAYRNDEWVVLERNMTHHIDPSKC